MIRQVQHVTLLSCVELACGNVAVCVCGEMWQCVCTNVSRCVAQMHEFELKITREYLMKLKPQSRTLDISHFSN